MTITENKNGAIITIYVKPNSSQFGITFEDNEIVVRCTEEPVKGKVNKELLKEFTKLIHANIVLISGATSKEKRLLIEGKTKTEIETFLQNRK